MKKIIIVPSSEKIVEKTKNIVDGFIIGIENLCTNICYCINKNNINILEKISNKDIFISINKNISDEELELVKDYLLLLNNYNIKGILVYDIGILIYIKNWI